jgi:predicted ArsR family transcriptional regulator
LLTARLAIVDTSAAGDAAPGELSAVLSLPTNRIAHHLKVLDKAGLVVRSRSEGDRRRTSSTSFAHPAVSIGRAFSDTFAGIAPGSLLVLYPDAGQAADSIVTPHTDTTGACT